MARHCNFGDNTFPAQSPQAAWNELDQKTYTTLNALSYSGCYWTQGRELDREEVRGCLRPWALKGRRTWWCETPEGCRWADPKPWGATGCSGIKSTPGPPILWPCFLKLAAPNSQNIKSQMGYTEWIHRQGARSPVCCRNRPGLDLSLLSSDKLEAGTDPQIQNKMAFNCDWTLKKMSCYLLSLTHAWHRTSWNSPLKPDLVFSQQRNNRMFPFYKGKC